MRNESEGQNVAEPYKLMFLIAEVGASTRLLQLLCTEIQTVITVTICKSDVLPLNGFIGLKCSDFSQTQRGGCIRPSDLKLTYDFGILFSVELQ